jgi:hypothetical protein
MAAIVTSYDPIENVIDFSNKFLQPSLTPQTLFDVISTGANLRRSEFHWWEQKKKPRTTALSGAYTIADGVLAVDSVAPFVAGSMVGLDAMVFRVISIAALNLTVELVDGTDANASSAAVVTAISNAQLEGSEGSLTTRNPKIKVENVSQIMRETAKVSMTQMDTDKEVGAQEMIENIAMIIKGFRDDSAGLLWNSFKVDPSDNLTARIAGGVAYYVAQNGYATSGTNIGANISTFISHMYDVIGAKPKQLWMNPATQKTFSAFDDDYFRRDIGTKTRGFVAVEFLTLNGVQLEIKTDVNIPVDKIYAMNSSDVVWRPLRNLKSTPLGKVGDYMEVEVVAEISVEVNPSCQMGVFTITA